MPRNGSLLSLQPVKGSRHIGKERTTTSTALRMYRQNARLFVTAMALLAAIWGVSSVRASSFEDRPADDRLQPLLNATIYVVQAGDNLSGIAAKVGIPTDLDWIAAVVSLNG